MSKNSYHFLARKGIIKDMSSPRPRYTMGQLHSHRRPVTPLRDLLDDDSPAKKVLTESQEDRKAFKRNC